MTNMLDVTAIVQKYADEQTLAATLPLQAEIVRLKKELEEPPVPEPPTPPSVSLFGVTVNGPVRKTMPELHPKVKVSRVFWDDMGELWPQEGEHKAFPESQWAVSCGESVTLGRLTAGLASIPAADKKKILAFCRTHEPENNAGMTPAKHRQMQEEAAPVIRAAGLRAASCLMGWTLDPDSGRNWKDWISKDAVDLLAWDRYNSGAKRQRYQEPTAMLKPILEASQQLGKPWALWETGTNTFGEQAPRSEWTDKLHDLIITENGEHAIWFDRTSTSGSGWDASLSKETAGIWLKAVK